MRPMLGVGRCNQKSAVCMQNGYISIRTRVEGIYSERIHPTAETLPPKTGMLRATRFTTIHAISRCRRSSAQVSFPLAAASHILRNSFHSIKAFGIQPNPPDHPKALLTISSQFSHYKHGGKKKSDSLRRAMSYELGFFRDLGNHHVILSLALRNKGIFRRWPAVTIHL